MIVFSAPENINNDMYSYIFWYVYAFDSQYYGAVTKYNCMVEISRPKPWLGRQDGYWLAALRSQTKMKTRSQI